MPVHIIASMIGHVLHMYKDYIVTHAQCLPRAMNLTQAFWPLPARRDFFF